MITPGYCSNIQRLLKLKQRYKFFDQTYTYAKIILIIKPENNESKIQHVRVGQEGNGIGEDQGGRCMYCSGSNCWVEWLVFITNNVMGK